jgi:hypothetical protein
MEMRNDIARLLRESRGSLARREASVKGKVRKEEIYCWRTPLKNPTPGNYRATEFSASRKVGKTQPRKTKSGLRG